MKVNEIFYSIQGEGRYTGRPAIFIRLAGCDLTCGFCDTEFESGKEMSCPDIIRKLIIDMETHNCKFIVWTGGEPALQLTDEIVKYFRGNKYYQAIETNGNNKVPNVDWITCSPKVAEHVLVKNFPNGVDELKYVRHSGQMSVPQPLIKATYKYLSPMFNGNDPDMKNIQHCIKLCKQNPEWMLSLQTHKLTKIL